MTELPSRNCVAVLRENVSRLIAGGGGGCVDTLTDVKLAGEILDRVLARDSRQLRLNDLWQLAAALKVAPHELLRPV